MAITFGTPTTSTSGSDGTTNTFAHTSDGNPLIVDVALHGNYTAGITATYNGVSMTQKYEKFQDTYFCVARFYLASPASGSNNVVVTWSNSAGFAISAMNISGADAPVNSNTAGGSSTTPSVNISSDASSVVVDSAMQRGTGTFTVGASQTELVNVTNSGGSRVRLCVSYETGSATTTMSWSSSVNDTWATGGLSFNTTATANTTNFMWLL